MVKIKKEVEMTLTELIDWGFKNNIENKEFFSNFFDKKSVIFNLNGWVEFSDKYAYFPEDTFTVEIEREITKDTKLDSVLEIYTNLDYTKSKFPDIHKSVSINDILGYTSNRIVTKCIYLVNEDDTLTLIWKNGKLV